MEIHLCKQVLPEGNGALVWCTFYQTGNGLRPWPGQPSCLLFKKSPDSSLLYSLSCWGIIPSFQVETLSKAGNYAGVDPRALKPCATWKVGPHFILGALLDIWKFLSGSISFNTIKTVHFLNWSIIALQWCVSFCCTKKWISHMYAYIPSFLDLPPSSLGHYRAWSWALCAINTV